MIALPYFLANGVQIAKYFYSNTRGAHSDIWSVSSTEPLLSVANTMRHYAHDLAGGHVFLAFVAGGCAAVYLLIKRDRAAALRWLLTVGVATASFTVMMVGRHRNGYFLATFSWLVLL